MSETLPASDTVQRPMPGTRLWGFSGGVILVVGVMLVPMAIGMVFTSYSAPDASDYVRMAFAQVAGATIAIVTVFGLLLHRIVRRSPFGTIAWFAFLAVAIGSWQLSGISRAAESLLMNLGILA
jgi:xanthine/uracil permease